MAKRIANLPTMVEHWRSYLAAYLPQDASPSQIQECRRAFFSGAWAAVSNLVRAHELSDAMVDEMAAAMERDLADYMQRVQDGTEADLDTAPRMQ